MVMNANPYRPRFGDVVGTGQFCGPCAISAVTGIDSREIARYVASVRRGLGVKAWSPTRVVGMHTGEVIAAMRHYGLEPVNTPLNRTEVRTRDFRTADGKPLTRSETVGQWLTRTAPWRGDDVYLIVTGDHFLTISGDSMVDNWNNGKVRPVSRMRFKRARLVAVYCIMREQAEDSD